jgi:hypothetical protein
MFSFLSRDASNANRAFSVFFCIDMLWTFNNHIPARPYVILSNTNFSDDKVSSKGSQEP